MLASVSHLQGRSVSHVSRAARSHPVLVTPTCLRTVSALKVQVRPTQHRSTLSVCRAQAGTPTLSYAETPSVGVMERGELSQFPGTPGVYAVFDKAGTLQYIGLSRQVRCAHTRHRRFTPGRQSVTANTWRQCEHHFQRFGS